MPTKNGVAKILTNAYALDNDELAELLEGLNREQFTRKTQEQKQDWENVRKTVRTYIEKWGSINVYDCNVTLQVDSCSDFSSMGEIDTEY